MDSSAWIWGLSILPPLATGSRVSGERLNRYRRRQQRLRKRLQAKKSSSSSAATEESAAVKSSGSPSTLTIGSSQKRIVAER